MLYFKAPEQYLSYYTSGERRTYELQCPRCGVAVTDNTRKYRKKQKDWRCRKCRHTYAIGNRVLVRTEPETMSPEEYVGWQIREDYGRAFDALHHTLKVPGLTTAIGAVAQVGMFSENSMYARDSMVVTAQAMYRQHQQQAYGAQVVQQIEDEYQLAVALADEHFHGQARRQAAATQVAEETAALGRAIADAMYQRVQEQRGAS